MDPLAQLQDIQLPEKIHSYPIAIGWWLLALICIGLILFIVIKIINNKKLRRSQQQALSQLTSNDTTEQCVTSLKWAALQYFPRESVANLYGNDFHQFLIRTLPAKYQEKFTALSGNTLQDMYQKNNNSNNNDDFHQAAIFWLKHALPPKEKLKLTLANNLSENNS